MTDTITQTDIVARLTVASQSRVNQGLSCRLFDDAVTEIVRLRSELAHRSGHSDPDRAAPDAVLDVHGVADVLHLETAKVYVLTLRDGSFPRPAVVLSSGPRWSRHAIDAWSAANHS